MGGHVPPEVGQLVEAFVFEGRLITPAEFEAWRRGPIGVSIHQIGVPAPTQPEAPQPLLGLSQHR